MTVSAGNVNVMRSSSTVVVGRRFDSGTGGVTVVSSVMVT